MRPVRCASRRRTESAIPRAIDRANPPATILSLLHLVFVRAPRAIGISCSGHVSIYHPRLDVRLRQQLHELKSAAALGHGDPRQRERVAQRLVAQDRFGFHEDVQRGGDGTQHDEDGTSAVMHRLTHRSRGRL
eukprot:5644587-Prymnesium_polylepis.1